METFIKQEGIAAIQSAGAEALEKKIKGLSLEANDHLINAAYAESLIPSVDEQIEQYRKLTEEKKAALAEIESREKYSKKETRPIEASIKALEGTQKKLEDRKTNALEKIRAHRFDAQMTMHKVAFIKSLTPDTLVQHLTTHIKSLEAPETPAE